MLRLITFDACNTLFHVRGSPGELYSNVASRFGVEINPKPLDDSFKYFFREFYKTLPNFGANKNKNCREMVVWSGNTNISFSWIPR